MTYAIADIHGCYAQYMALLEQVSLGENDTLYVLGDAIDRGPEPMRVLTDMSMRFNVLPVLGNHEYMMRATLPRLMNEITAENYDRTLTADWMEGYLHWINDGGGITIEQFRRLPGDEREGLLEYLDEFTPYETLTLGNQRYVLAHAGIDSYKPGRPLDSYAEEQFLFTRPYAAQRFDGFRLICGHTPTFAIDRAHAGEIIERNGVIYLDCGAVYGNPLGMLCLETGEKFYAPA
jgi:serine/threonine protein phosphatase 1